MFKDYMIQARLWSGIFYSISYPCIHLYLMNNINTKLLAFNEIIICLFIIIINSLWNKYSNILYKYLPIFFFSESIICLVLYLLLIFNITTVTIYYIIDTILFCRITQNIICGSNKLKTIIYDNTTREKYDNTVSIASSIATIIGSIVALIINIPINLALIISWIGVSIDNLLYYIAYKKGKRN